ncbi:uracil phosphoribosyltransferase [Mycoplasma ovis str. Michigan]|uniref:Uracil phosphoribosyltransferase n=1 Tax=Mycoplasma ovis str. Michigan TaxID=1415773 RepID=A0ABM5P0V3_9MOLU|nr:uracil phosphoribosyltransferase [Mycoplasma ovis]AHC40060.1 uracil phosphoribosyltransferase [Mycoplasma ovis str. Michigan]
MSVIVSKNNLIKNFLINVRNKNSSSFVFGSNLKKITLALLTEAHSEFPMENTTVDSPFGSCPAQKISKTITVVPVLRSGLAMSDAIQTFFEDCQVVHIGIYRDTDLSAVSYYEKFPSGMENSKVILCDPLIATAVTLSKSLDILARYNCKDITVLGIIISKHAVKLLTEKYPNLNIYVAAVDDELNSKGYIIPGAGDAGDRLFRTK